MITRRSNREVWLALVAAALAGLSYLGVLAAWKEIPAAGEFYGHTLGVLGFVLMLMTETLYSLRKRSRAAHWGRMSDWLSFHIFTGIVGPFLVLLHSSWKFNGLAGAVTLLMALVVFSGFVGRYIYTAIPRSADGLELEASALESEISSLSRQLADGAPASREQKNLHRRLERLERQKSRLSQARRFFSLWHTVHIPIGMALFAAAFIHIVGAVYYATLLH